MDMVGLLLQCGFLLAVLHQSSANPQPVLRYEWAEVDYDFSHSPNGNRSTQIATGTFKPQNCAVTGIKWYKGVTYVSVPRWRDGVPATLCKVSADGKLLEPFPSWDMQTPGNYSALQYVQSMEIDPIGRMWILDTGRRYFLGPPSQIVNGPPKLVLYDLNSGRLLRTFVFPDEVAPYSSSFLNDLAVDPTAEVAYISDAGADGGALVVYDYKSNTARRWSGPSTSADPSVRFTINGVRYAPGAISTPEDGIALSPSLDRIYYCALQGLHLYSLPTAVLRDFHTTHAEIEAAVTDHGEKASPSDGITMSSDGLLYYGGLTTDSLYVWDPSRPLSASTAVAQSDTGLHWIDTFAFDGHGNLLFTTNKLDRYLQHNMSFAPTGVANFRVWSLFIHADSYMHGHAPAPSPPSAGGPSPYTLVAIVIGALVLFALLALIALLRSRAQAASAAAHTSGATAGRVGTTVRSSWFATPNPSGGGDSSVGSGEGDGGVLHSNGLDERLLVRATPASSFGSTWGPVVN